MTASVATASGALAASRGVKHVLLISVDGTPRT